MALFEHASGYGLFHVKEFEEIAMLQTAVEESVTDISAFNSVVTLQSFQPFKNAEDALANINAVSEGLCSDQLKFFLQSNMPKKLKKVTLGVLDPKLGAAVSESIGVKVIFYLKLERNTPVLPENWTTNLGFWELLRGLAAGDGLTRRGFSSIFAKFHDFSK